MNSLDKKKFSFDVIEEWLCIAMLLLMFIAIGANIVMNWTMRLRSGKLEELGTSAYMFCCYAAFGWMYKRKDLTEVTFVVNSMGPKLRWFSELFRVLFIAFFGVLLTIRSYQLCGNSIIKKLPALQVPYIYLDVSLLFGYFMLTVRSLCDIVKHILCFKEVFSKEGD